MKKIFLYILLATLVINFSGCKKDKNSDTTSIAVYGLWQITASTLLPTLKFVKFTNGKQLFAYSQTAEGFRSTINNNFSPSSDQIVANFQGGYYTPLTVFNYTISGNILTVVGDNGETYFTATKSTSTDPDSWTTPVSSSDHIDNLFTNNTQGIGFDGNNLLFADYSNGKIIKVSLATRTIVSEITTVSSLNTVEYDGANYWVSSNGYNTIQKINSTGTSIFTSTAPMAAWIYGIGNVSPTSIICYSNNGQTIYNYNPVSDIVAGSLATPGIQLGDLAINNGKIFIAQRNGNFIYRIDPVTFSVEKTYSVTDAVDINGIASVGGNVFWLNTNSGKSVLKVTLN